MQTVLAIAVALTVIGVTSSAGAQGRVLPTFSGMDCLVLDSNDACAPDVRITIANDCSGDVTLVEWPLTSCPADQDTCSFALGRGQVIESAATQPSQASRRVVDSEGREVEGVLRIECESDGCAVVPSANPSSAFTYGGLACLLLFIRARSRHG